MMIDKFMLSNSDMVNYVTYTCHEHPRKSILF